MDQPDKIDFVKQDKLFYNAPTEPAIVEVPPMRYLMYDGQGVPENNPEFQRAFQALYGVAYTIKFMPKLGDVPPGYRDFKVPPPEGLWWMADGQPFDQSRPRDWRWTLMIRVPDFVTPQVADTAIAEMVIKKKDEVYRRLRLETLDEGPAVQLLHIGPYDSEQDSLARMDAFAADQGYTYTGKHHEIYFGDPNRTKPEKLKTILRHPVTTKVQAKTNAII